jgi:hypothetical protein
MVEAHDLYLVFHPIFEAVVVKVLRYTLVWRARHGHNQQEYQ